MREQTDASLRVLAIEPYFGLSHKMFLEGYQRYSNHRVEIWELPARKWKWRMRGSAYHFADRARELQEDEAPDLVLASDFLNLADWRALAPGRFGRAPAVLYFHENQITYPLSHQAPVDFHYGWINLSSSLAADRVLFNSSYHREAYLAELARVLQRMPDFVPAGLAERIRQRSEVFPVGIDFQPHRQFLQRRPRLAAKGNDAALILWNHRWEHDKGPERFVEALVRLKESGVPFRVLICGQAGATPPSAFALAAETLADEILHMGFYEARDDYFAALQAADVVVSTARHEFFGVSVIEAIYMGCLPVLPRDLSYPEIIPGHLHERFLYDDPQVLHEFLADFLRDPPTQHREELRAVVERYDWKLLAGRLDSIVSETHAAVPDEKSGP